MRDYQARSRHSSVVGKPEEAEIMAPTHRPDAGKGEVRAAGWQRGVGVLLRLQRQRGNLYAQRVVSRCMEAGGDTATPQVQQAIESSRAGGQPLDGAARVRMEQAFNADFSSVRVHTGAAADSLSRALHARAFTTGKDVFFRHGEYNPGSSNGKQLLAHELTHVVQQNPDTRQRQDEAKVSTSGCSCSGGRSLPRTVQAKLTIGRPGDVYEQEADHVAENFSAWEQRASRIPDSSPMIGRDSVKPEKAAGLVQRGCRACEQQAELAESLAHEADRVDGVQGLRLFEQDAAGLMGSPSIQRDPFDPVGPDNSSCRDKVSEDGARCADHANTMCSVVGAGTAGSAAMVLGGIGTLVAPGAGTLIGGALGLGVGAIGGALLYGRCVERMNAACRARTNAALRNCDTSFPPIVGSVEPEPPTGGETETFVATETQTTREPEIGSA